MIWFSYSYSINIIFFLYLILSLLNMLYYLFYLYTGYHLIPYLTNSFYYAIRYFYPNSFSILFKSTVPHFGISPTSICQQDLMMLFHFHICASVHYFHFIFIMFFIFPGKIFTSLKFSLYFTYITLSSNRISFTLRSIFIRALV